MAKPAKGTEEFYQTALDCIEYVGTMKWGDTVDNFKKRVRQAKIALRKSYETKRLVKPEDMED